MSRCAFCGTIGRVRPTDPPRAQFLDAWPGRTFRGTVAQIRQAPINVQNVITYDVVIHVANGQFSLPDHFHHF